MEQPGQLKLETARMSLVEISPQWIRYVFGTYSDDETLVRLLSIPNKEAIDLERQKYEGGLTTYWTSFKGFALYDKVTGRLLGRTGFHNWYSIHKRAELGYVLYDAADFRKGYMYETNIAVIRYGFQHMGLNRVQAFTGSSNRASISVLLKLGFTVEGLHRKDFIFNGVVEDSICFGLLKDDFRNLSIYHDA